MSTKIGRFEILSEITKSEWGAVYKAHDPSNGQTVALKTIRLDMPPDEVKQRVEGILAEAESSKVLNHQNIALLYGAGEIENQFCAAMEYVQGNSIATMLARKEGFSIWDLLDISRQVCHALDHAHSNSVFHYSLEPAKVMVQWDGTVKILDFGISTMAMLDPGASRKVPAALHYASPEQVNGAPLTACSNLFTWGTVLYQMVTDLKAFDGEDGDTVCRKIVEEIPTPPIEINKKIHRGVSDLIMKAISKSPADRFQNGRELLAELEVCKQASAQPAKKDKASAPGLSVPKNTAAIASKFAGQPGVKSDAAPSEVSKAQDKAVERKGIVGSALAPRKKESAAEAPQPKSATTKPKPPASTEPLPQKRAAAAAAGATTSKASQAVPGLPKLDPSARFISSCVKASVEALEKEEAKMSAATAEETEAPPNFTVDPMMAENEGEGKKPVSFSDLDELPPLKETYVAPPPPPDVNAEEEPLIPVSIPSRERQKTKVQPREVAEKAIQEIKTVPPKLMLYAVSVAVGLILVIVVLIAFYIRSQNAEEEGAQAPPSAAPVQSQPAPSEPVAVAAPPVALSPTPAETEPTSRVQVAPVVKSRQSKKKVPTPAPVAVVPGVLAINSTPEGAQFQLDGRSDPSWITPYSMSGLNPGQHTINVSKPGYSSETRNVNVASGSKSFAVIHLAQLAATVSVTSEPTGAAVYVDAKDTGRVTPTQLTLDKGPHTLVVKKQGYLDETTTADLQPGQNFHFSPALRALGSVDDLKTVGKVKKFFGGGGDTAGRGLVSIKTSPKGAQIAVNRRMLEKGSPVEFLLNPGNYVIDISLSGYKSVQRVINVDKGNKIALDETLERE